MNTKFETIVDSIYKKLKNYRDKEIFLEKEVLKKFIFSLLKEKWSYKKYNKNCYSKSIKVNWIMYSFSNLTIFLVITFIVSLYFLFKVTSNAKS